MNASRLRRVAVHLAVLLTYTGLTFIYVRPLALHLGRTIPRAEQHDVLLHGWILNWTARQVLRAPWDLFQANIFFPWPDALSYTEHLLPEALPVAPLWALTGDPVLTYNVAYVLTFVLGGWGMFLLVRRLTGDPWAALVAGAFCCYFPAKRWNLAHINTIAVHGVPLALLALHRLLERPRAGRAVVAGLFVALAALASAYYTVYLPLLLVVGVPLLARAAGHSLLEPRRAAAVGAAAAVALLVAVTVLWPYTRTWSGAEPAHAFDLQVAGAADAGEFLILDSLLWRRWLVPGDLGPLTSPFFPGVVATALALVALFGQRPATGVDSGDRRHLRAAGLVAGTVGAVVLLRHLVLHHRATLGAAPPPPFPVAVVLGLGTAAVALLLAADGRRFPVVARAALARWRAAPPMARAHAAIFGVAVILALGPRLKFFGYVGPPLPYELVYRYMPGAGSLRAPFRAAILGQVFLAVLVGYGAAAVLARLRARRAGGAGRRAAALAAVLLVAVMVGENVGRPLPLDDLPRPATRVYEWIAGQPGDFGILDWPIADSMDRTATGQWLSTRHWKRRVTGHNGRLPADIHRLWELSFDPMSDEFMEFLRDRFPVRYVVVHLHEFDAATRTWLLEEGLPGVEAWWEPVRDLGDDRVYRVRNGGTLGRLQRRFAAWMVRGTLVLDLATPVPLEAAAGSLVVETGREEDGSDHRVLASVPVEAGQTAVEVEIGADAVTGAAPVWVRLTLAGSAAPLEVTAVRFRTPAGVVYP